jgi:hypothetical protein
MERESPFSSWNAVHVLSALTLGGIILWGFAQCEDSKEGQKSKTWRLDQCFTGTSTGEKRCFQGTNLYTREDCEEGAAGLRSMPNFISAQCSPDSRERRPPWKWIWDSPSN